MRNLKLPENWDSLPVEEIQMGGVKRKIRYDNENNTVYLLNSRGEWTGEIGHPQSKKPAGAVTQPASDDEQQTPQEQTRNATKESEPSPVAAAQKGAKKKSKTTPFLLIIIAVLAAILIFQNVDFGGTPKSYEILYAGDNITPGEVLGKKIYKRKISAAEYQQYLASGTGIYLLDDYETIKNYEATCFIPKDGIFTYANIAQDFNVVNPWRLENQTYLINIPVSLVKEQLGELLWGNKVSITVTNTWELTQKEYPDAYRPSSPQVSGGTHTTTYQTDTYTLSNVTVIDVLNYEQKSLFSIYASLAAIPETYQQESIASRYKSSDQRRAERPAYICVAVSKETVAWWNEVSNKKNAEMTVSVQYLNAIDSTTGNADYEYKFSANAAFRKMAEMIQKALG